MELKNLMCQSVNKNKVRTHTSYNYFCNKAKDVICFYDEYVKTVKNIVFLCFSLCSLNLREYHFKIPFIIVRGVLSYQLKLIKMRAKLANVNHCAAPFFSRAAVSLW